MKGTGEYNPDFKQKALALKERWLWRCERCGHAVLHTSKKTIERRQINKRQLELALC